MTSIEIQFVFLLVLHASMLIFTLSRAFVNLDLSCAPSLLRSLCVSPCCHSVIGFVSFSPPLSLSLRCHFFCQVSHSLSRTFPTCRQRMGIDYASWSLELLGRMRVAMKTKVGQVSCLVVPRSSVSRFYRVLHKQLNRLQEHRATGIKQKTTKYINTPNNNICMR